MTGGADSPKDQAGRLRAMTADGVADAEPLSVAVVGAKGGVGASTLALALAEAIVDRPATLLDAHWGQTDLGVVAQLEDDAPTRRPIAVAQWLGDTGWKPNEPSADRVFRRIADASPGVTVLDAGPAATPWARQVAQRADIALLVATPDRLALMNAYAAAKRLRSEGVAPRLLWNGCASAAQAEAAQDRIDATCAGAGLPPLETVGWTPARGAAPKDHQRFCDATRRLAAALTVGESAASLEPAGTQAA